MRIKARYYSRLERYLKWKSTVSFLRSASLPFDKDAPSAAECMLRWEAKGEIPRITSEPELLADYIEGKTRRDFQIKEWTDGVKEKLFFPEEFLGTAGMDEEEFISVFGREPEPTLVALFQYYDRLQKEIIGEFNEWNLSNRHNRNVSDG